VEALLFAARELTMSRLASAVEVAAPDVMIRQAKVSPPVIGEGNSLSRGGCSADAIPEIPASANDEPGDWRRVGIGT
jgi:hypothetical protein